MLSIFEAILPIFSIMVLGFCLRKFGFIARNNWKIVEDLCFWILFPAILLKFIATADFSNLTLGPLVFTVIAFTAVMGLITLSEWPLLKSLMTTTRAQFSTVYQTTTRWNGFVALIIALSLYGDKSAPTMALILAIMTVIIQISNLFVLAAFTPGPHDKSGKRPNLAGIFLMVAKNPIVVSIIVGFIINFSGLTLWQPIDNTLDLLGRAALGLSLLAIGAGLSLQAVLKPSRELLVGLTGKLIISPVIMLGLALFFGITGLTLSILILCAAVPTAANGYLFAKKMGGDAELYAATLTAQTMLSFLTIPLFLVIAQQYGGM